MKISTDGVRIGQTFKCSKAYPTGSLNTEIDLSEYSGRVYLGFHIFSNRSTNKEGWYIDDVGLSETSHYSDDSEAPVIKHNAPLEVYSEMDLVLKANVTDNLRIAYVNLHYKDTNGAWQEMQAKQDSGTDIGGIFSTTIPGDRVTGESITYYFETSDYGKNIVKTEEYTVAVKPGVGIGYFEDFEGSPSGWYSFGANNTWEMGVPTSGPKAAVSGKNVYATNLAGTYLSNMNATLVMPAIDLPEGNAFLTFKNWHNFEQSTSGTAYDYGHVVISTTRSTGNNRKFQGLTSDWKDVEIDLSAYSGQRVYVGFHGFSDGSTVEEMVGILTM